MKMETLSFRDKFDVLLEKRLSGVAGLKYIRLYGKSQIEDIMAGWRSDQYRVRLTIFNKTTSETKSLDRSM